GGTGQARTRQARQAVWHQLRAVRGSCQGDRGKVGGLVSRRSLLDRGRAARTPLRAAFRYVDRHRGRYRLLLLRGAGRGKEAMMAEATTGTRNSISALGLSSGETR